MNAYPQPTERGQLEGVAWKKYVGLLCVEAWDLDAAAIDALVAELETLLRQGCATDSLLVAALVGAGVSERSAMTVAPSIRVAMVS